MRFIYKCIYNQVEHDYMYCMDGRMDVWDRVWWVGMVVVIQSDCDQPINCSQVGRWVDEKNQCKIDAGVVRS